MKKTTIIFSACILICIAGCGGGKPNTIMQVSTIDALLSGAYQGQMSCKKLTSYGNFGVGTFDKLDGEMVMLGGKIYQITADGKVHKPKKKLTTPFATVVKFRKDSVIKLKNKANYERLKNLIAAVAPRENLFCAIKIKGSFSKMKVRSLPAQAEPFGPITEAVKNQSVFEFENIRGTIVGFRFPAYINRVNIPGYYLNFLSKDRKIGGHILSFELEEGTGEIDVCNRLLMVLPLGETTFSEIDLNVDRSSELENLLKRTPVK